MSIPKLNWFLWAGFLLTLAGFVSYFAVFVNYPVTRDFPWANFVLFAFALVLVVLGLRRAFAADRSRLSKVAGIVVTALSVLVIGAFIFTTLIAARWLPAAAGAPKLGQKAPEFSLADSSGKQVSLSELRSAPIDGKPAKGVLLIFYRGYW